MKTLLSGLRRLAQRLYDARLAQAMREIDRHRQFLRAERTAGLAAVRIAASRPVRVPARSATRP